MGVQRAVWVFALLGACKAGGGGGGKDAGDEAFSLDVYPPEGARGTSMEVSVGSSRSVFTFGDTTVDLGEGITVDQVDVDDGFGLRAAVTIEPDAELGPRTVSVETGSRTLTIPDGFEVIDQSFSVEPDSGLMGETLDLELVGHNTDWASGVTWPSFGDGIEVVEFTVLSETLAEATVTISPDAAPGWRNVVMDNGGGDRVTLYDGFKVDRVALAATFDPPEAEQGDTVEFTIQARGTDFLAAGDAGPAISFRDAWGDNPDIVVDSVTVLDSENLFGQMTLSNAASLGSRDVVVDSGDEAVLIPDAFEVIGGDWSLEEVAISLYFVVLREKDNDTGEIYERVLANCQFYIPLDPPCPSGGGSGSGSGNLDYPTPYDNNQVFGVTGSGESTEDDCPYPTTLSAGDHVWLESDANTVTLDKHIDSASGVIYYTNDDLTLADYVPDNVYDLHTEGDPDAIGEYLLEEVLPTVPADWEWLSPDLWGNYTQSRAEDFTFTWTPAQTYPDAIFMVEIFDYNNLGPLAEDGWYGYLGVYPWDDGEHTFTASELSMFAPGWVPVTAFSYIQGREFGLPESIYQTNQAFSYISLYQTMILE